MKSLLVAEYRDGKVLGSIGDLLGFAARVGGDHVMFMVGSEAALPPYTGKLYLADAAAHGEYRPGVHKQLLLAVIEKEQPDLVVFSHSSYGWDLAPRVACVLGFAQVSEVVDYVDNTPVVPVCNAKLRRTVAVKSKGAVLTLQAGAFGLSEPPSGSPSVEKVQIDGADRVEFLGYEAAEAGGIDLSKAEVIVSAGRGIGKAENISLIADLAKALGGEYGASRPVVDSEWAEHDRQVGTTGQTVAPKLYVACGISGAIQHLAGMKKSDFIIAINTDRDAPIGDVADVLAVADLTKLVPVLVEKLNAR
ncbi:electron transfer flavoprotein subunit alpha/FixB family protein [Desulfofustis limnaeus]|jgi:electron transfer flavoprotein alpha subunit|uniref:Electron transfer flavoprotein subunit alpha n=1 Tax=Desulfofustis limnaeus TaxID=2740163 RepID=A0ABN6M9Q6_9BACT|nr:electron transfer flavoprotein subunit alpha/FixB family protein [Desulfofustis limnaeus]MDX9896662.1 electron transfer flavoprotein subunit alpha/FixB family protein [Desulfofustis sp.]BDD88303.1 electron transfer flavoprotein subunit alpha [Desulfofustis limnaeus]